MLYGISVSILKADYVFVKTDHIAFAFRQKGDNTSPRQQRYLHFIWLLQLR